jgi:hypothetical protein
MARGVQGGVALAVTRYSVKAGDTLCDIAGSTLGSPVQWRRIWRYNNRPAVICVTGRGIPNPDLIYPGQLLLIPTLPAQNIAAAAPVRSPSPATPSISPAAAAPGRAPLSAQPERGPNPRATGKLTDELKHVASPISIKYRLDDLRFPPITQPGVTMEMRMTGDVLIMTQRTYPAVYVTQRKLEAQVVSQANHALGALVSDSRFIFDEAEDPHLSVHARPPELLDGCDCPASPGT